MSPGKPDVVVHICSLNTPEADQMEQNWRHEKEKDLNGREPLLAKKNSSIINDSYKGFWYKTDLAFIYRYLMFR